MTYTQFLKEIRERAEVVITNAVKDYGRGRENGALHYFFADELGVNIPFKISPFTHNGLDKYIPVAAILSPRGKVYIEGQIYGTSETYAFPTEEVDLYLLAFIADRIEYIQKI
jgi:hypothetical protein